METKKKVKIVILTCVILVVAAVIIDPAAAWGNCFWWFGHYTCFMKQADLGLDCENRHLVYFFTYKLSKQY